MITVETGATVLFLNFQQTGTIRQRGRIFRSNPFDDRASLCSLFGPWVVKGWVIRRATRAPLIAQWIRADQEEKAGAFFAPTAQQINSSKLKPRRTSKTYSFFPLRRRGRGRFLFGRDSSMLRFRAYMMSTTFRHVAVPALKWLPLCLCSLHRASPARESDTPLYNSPG